MVREVYCADEVALGVNLTSDMSSYSSLPCGNEVGDALTPRACLGTPVLRVRVVLNFLI